MYDCSLNASPLCLKAEDVTDHDASITYTSSKSKQDSITQPQVDRVSISSELEKHKFVDFSDGESSSVSRFSGNSRHKYRK